MTSKRRMMYKISMLGVCMGLLFGCGRNKKVNREEVVKNYLEKQYGSSFVVEKMVQKGGGPFLEHLYSGFAYKESEPAQKFNIWYDPRTNDVIDAHFVLNLLPEIEQAAKAKIEKYWPLAKVQANVDIYGAIAKDESYSDMEDLINNTSVNVLISLAMPKDDFNVNDLYDLTCDLKTTFNGIILLYFNDDYENVDFSKNNPDHRIYMDTKLEFIKNEFNE